MIWLKALILGAGRVGRKTYAIAITLTTTTAPIPAILPKLREDNRSLIVGFAIDPEGDMQNLFNNGGPKGAGVDAAAHAIDLGGKTLDAFDGYLPGLYSQLGMVETGRVKFNPDYAPEGWNLERDDSPDVVFMRFAGWPGGDRQGAIARAKNPAAWRAHEQSARYYDDWDEAKKASRERASRVRHDGTMSDVANDYPPEAAKYTPGEREVLAAVARTHGWEWALRNAERTLDEARAIQGEDLE